MPFIAEDIPTPSILVRLGPDARVMGDPFCKVATVVIDGKTATVKGFSDDSEEREVLPKHFTVEDFRDLERMLSERGVDIVSWERHTKHGDRPVTRAVRHYLYTKGA